MKRLITLLALAMPLMAAPAFAQTKPNAAPALVVAVVDGNLLTMQAKAMKSAQEEAEKLAKKFDADFGAEQKKLQTEAQTLEKDRAKITGDEYDRRQQRLAQRVTDIRRTAQIRQEQMARSVRQVQVLFRAEVVQIIQAIAVEEGYTMVIEKSAVLHAAAPFDITAKVLERLDKTQTQIKFEFPPRAEPGAPAAQPDAPEKPATPPKKTN